MPEKLFFSTKMSGKMKGFHSLATSPLDCEFCDKMAKVEGSICSFCYSRKAMRTYASRARPRWKKNGEILSTRILAEDELPTIDRKYFRLQSHGELINETHYINLINIAKKNPKTLFKLPTKQKGIVAKLGKMGADNVFLTYSEPMLNHFTNVIPKNFDRKFSVFTPEYAEENGIELNCAGKKCMDCLQCYTTNDIKFINEHKR